MIKKLISLNLALVMLFSLVTVQVFATGPENQLEEELPEKYILIDGEVYDAAQQHYSEGWEFYPADEWNNACLYLYDYTGGFISCSEALYVDINGTTTIVGEEGTPALSAKGDLFVAIYGPTALIGGDGASAVEASGTLEVHSWAEAGSDVYFFSGGNDIPAVSAEQEFIVNQCVMFAGETKDSLQYCASYSGEPVLRFAPVSEIPEEYITEYIMIDGKKYDAGYDHDGDGWEFHPNDYLRLYDYNGGPIVCTGALELCIDGATTITGTDGKPAVSVNGDATIALDAPAVLTGGKDAPAVEVSGNMNINRVYRYDDNGLTVGNDELYLISGGEDIPAIFCEEEIGIYESALFAGAAKEDLQYVTAYANQPVLRLAGAGEIPEEFITEYIMIDGQKYDAGYNHYGDGWRYESGTDWNDARLYLDDYSGGPIACTESLLVNGSSDNENATIIGNGGSAIQVEGVLTVAGNLTAIGDDAPAFDADEVQFGWGWPLRVVLGDSADNAVVTEYHDYNNIDAVYNGETYVHLEEIPYIATLHGNGGVTEDGQDTYQIIQLNTTPGWCSLYYEQDRFSNGDAELLGWNESPESTGEILYQPDEMNVFFTDGEITMDLYAQWDSETTKGIFLEGYYSKDADGRKVFALDKGDAFTLPDSQKGGANMLGWRGEDGELYPVGTEISVTDSVTFTAEYESLYLEIDGKKYTADEHHSADGWYYSGGWSSTPWLNIYEDYSGDPIKIPCDIKIQILEASITGSEGTPAISVDGDAYVHVGCSIQLTGGKDASALQVSGNLDIQSHLDSESDFYLVSGGENSAALSVGGDINLYDGSLYTGNTKEDLTFVTSYSDEPVVCISEYFMLRGETVIPEAPEQQGYTFIAWEDTETGACYLPGDEVNAGEGMNLTARWNRDSYVDAAILLVGQGGITDDGSTCFFTFASYGQMVTYEELNNSFTQEGKVLVGYNTSPRGNGEWFQPGDVLETSQVLHKYYAQWEDAYTYFPEEGVELYCLPEQEVIEITLSSEWCEENGVASAVGATYIGGQMVNNGTNTFDGGDLTVTIPYEPGTTPICKIIVLDENYAPVRPNFACDMAELMK